MKDGTNNSIDLPQLHYSPGFKVNFEVKRRLYDCLQRIVENVEEITKIDVSLKISRFEQSFLVV